MRTCFHGLRALAGQALRALGVFDAAEIAWPGHLFPRETLEILRPVVGAANARRRLIALATEPDGRPNRQHLVHELRLDLQLTALERDWPFLDELIGRARTLSRAACAPALGSIADWAHAVRLPDRGEAREARALALSSITKLEEDGERYLASRLLVDLLPTLDPDRARDVAKRAAKRLDAMGATISASEARAYL